jgi:uncharacterized RDD family membrane protein YckC
LWLLIPLLGLLFVLSGYAITCFLAQVTIESAPLVENIEANVLTNEVIDLENDNFDVVALESNLTEDDLELSQYTLRLTILKIITAVLSLVGVVLVIMIPVGIGFGIYYLTKKKKIELPHLMKKYAGFWFRFLAYIIDSIILSFGFTIIMSFWDLLIAESFSLVENFYLLFVIYAVSIVGMWLYYALFESSNIQATPGKLALNLKVTDLEGKKISFGQATGRHFAKIISSFIFYIGFFMIGWTAKKQGLHDKIASTYVLKKD